MCQHFWKYKGNFSKYKRKMWSLGFPLFFFENNFLNEFQMHGCIPDIQTLQSTPILAYIWLSYAIWHMLHYAPFLPYMTKMIKKWHIWHKWRIWHIPYDSHIYAYMGVKLSVWVSGMQSCLWNSFKKLFSKKKRGKPSDHIFPLYFEKFPLYF